jgi:hypothetical protein
MEPIDIVWIVGLIGIIYFTFIRKGPFDKKSGLKPEKKHSAK